MKLQSFIYIGPSVAPIGLKQNMLFRGGDPPPKLLTIIKQKPMVSSLFIPTADLAAAKRKINQKGSLEYTASKAMLEIAKMIPR